MSIETWGEKSRSNATIVRNGIESELDPNRVALALGALVGGWHLVWSVLVATEFAQPFIDFLSWLHFIKPVYVVEPFEITRALILIGGTAIVAYLFGGLFALLWNRVRA